MSKLMVVVAGCQCWNCKVSGCRKGKAL